MYDADRAEIKDEDDWVEESNGVFSLSTRTYPIPDKNLSPVAISALNVQPALHFFSA